MLDKRSIVWITITFIVVLIIYIIWSIFLQPTPQVSQADRLKQIAAELSSLVSETNSWITNIVNGAKENKQDAEFKVALYSKCITENNKLIELNKQITVSDFMNWWIINSWINCNTFKLHKPSTTWTATGAINPVPSWPLNPSQLYLTAKVIDKCYASQTPEQHYKANKRLAWDVVCNFWWDTIWQFQLYAPDYNQQSQVYTVTDVYYAQDTGNTIDLTFWNKRWTIWHIKTVLKKGQTVKTWQLIWQTDLSWVTSWHHSHIELWIEWRNVAYDTYSKKLDTFRKTPSPKVPYWWWSTYYFTPYNLWDVNQNDASPCIWASGKDLCEMEANWIRTIALTADVRNSLWIKFWDKVKLEWPCAWVYQVEDEMNCRFRWKPCWYMKNWERVRHPTWHVLRSGTNLYIKWDIPSCGWGAHKILPV